MKMTEEHHRETTQTIPDRFLGHWSVISYKTPTDDGAYGEILGHWVITPSTVQCDDASLLQVRKVEADIEPHQDMHLLSFLDNGLQFAFLRSNKHHEVLVVQYLGGQERMRCVIKRNDQDVEPEGSPYR